MSYFQKFYIHYSRLSDAPVIGKRSYESLNLF